MGVTSKKRKIHEIKVRGPHFNAALRTIPASRALVVEMLGIVFLRVGIIIAREALEASTLIDIIEQDNYEFAR